MSHAQDVPKEHWFALNQVIRMRAIAMVAEKAGASRDPGHPPDGLGEQQRTRLRRPAERQDRQPAGSSGHLRTALVLRSPRADHRRPVPRDCSTGETPAGRPPMRSSTRSEPSPRPRHSNTGLALEFSPTAAMGFPAAWSLGFRSSLPTVNRGPSPRALPRRPRP